MPDRLIRESICTSDTLSKLSDFEERFWHRLTVTVDDYGRFDARPEILKGRLFPLRRGTTERNMQDALERLASVGLVSLYTVDGKPYLQLVTWSRYQRIRNKRSKFPAPPGVDDPPGADDPPQSAAQCARNPVGIQSQSESESREDCAAPPDGTPLLSFPCAGEQKEFAVTGEMAEQWEALYPAADVMQELRCMLGWLLANPRRRKTHDGTPRFITGWLSKAQDRGKATGPTPYDYEGGGESL